MPVTCQACFSRWLTSQSQSICAKDEGCKVGKSSHSCPDGNSDVLGCVLVWQLLPTKVGADAGAEEEQQVGEEPSLKCAPAKPFLMPGCSTFQDWGNVCQVTC